MLKIAVLEPKPFESYYAPSKLHEGVEYKPIRYLGNGYTDHGKKSTNSLIKGLLKGLTVKEISEGVEIYYTKNDSTGLKWCADNGVHIITMSTVDHLTLVDKTVIETILEPTTLLFTSAGNTGRYVDELKRMEQGAALRRAWIPVGAIDIHDEPQDYSSYGAGKVMFADYDDIDNDGIGDGTSFSCPFLAGKIGVYYYKFNKLKGRYPTPYEAKEWAIDNCVDVYLPGKDLKTGYGKLVIPKTIVDTDRDPYYYMIHHSATKDNPYANNWQGVVNFHVNDLGYRDVGYDRGTEYVENMLVTYEGRDEATKGAHCNDNGMNTNALSHCMIGNFDIDKPTDEMITEVVMQKLAAEKRWGRKLEYRFHRDDTPKTCPGMNINIDMFIEKENEILAEININKPSEWAKVSWEKAIDLKVTDGTNPKGNVTREQVIVMLDRLNLLK